MNISPNILAEALGEIGTTVRVKTLSTDRPLVCIVECEDCGLFVVTDPDFVSIFYLPGGESVTGITLCFYCERPVTDGNLSFDMVKSLIGKGVQSFNWETGEVDGIG